MQYTAARERYFRFWLLILPICATFSGKTCALNPSSLLAYLLA
ncbi:hypothetical protein HMPREF1576_01442 [Gardnerella pickettii JCP7719]|uniref:Uncharacterized protein n=1 Tax=Gardnerella pickettii JCP7719 TaxID=1261061 RepID=S4GUQ2_9BIFI|nr:hypothetical protein HMPREF1582_01340 [Gardnerella vaginalis JCP8151A]EPI49334.1 hypothetical protein HMPREF1576_01442 [Gardnerella pickettii JCP7719]